MGFIKTATILIILILDPVLSVESDFVQIIKCCPENFIINPSGCVINDTIKLTVPVYKNDHLTRDDSMKINFAYYPVKCINNEKENFIRQPQFSPSESLFMQNDGRLWVPKVKTYFSKHQFCLDNYEELGIVALICIPGFEVIDEESMDDVSQAIAMIGTLISLPFLLVTFVVYALLPERTLYGKCLMSYVFSLFWAYFIPNFCFIYDTYARVSLLTCRIIGMCDYFLIIVSFFWMNVIAFDIWLKFRNGGILNNEKTRFLRYNIYAWGVPLLPIMLIVTLANTVPETAWYSPFEIEECWFKEGYTLLLYFYGLIGILITINIYFFISTAWKILKTRKQTAMLRQEGNKTHNLENEAVVSYKVYVKLLFAMGINWSMEIISWFVTWKIGPLPYLWYLIDVCNAGFGAFIFFLFVFNRSTWKLLKKRYHMVTGKAHNTTQKTTKILDTETTSTSF